MGRNLRIWHVSEQEAGERVECAKQFKKINRFTNHVGDDFKINSFPCLIFIKRILQTSPSIRLLQPRRALICALMGVNVRAKSPDAIWGVSALGWAPFVPWSVTLWTKYRFCIFSLHFYHTSGARNGRAREAVKHFKYGAMFVGKDGACRSPPEKGDSLSWNSAIPCVPGSVHPATGSYHHSHNKEGSRTPHEVRIGVGKCHYRWVGLGGWLSCPLVEGLWKGDKEGHSHWLFLAVTMTFKKNNNKF